MAFFKYFPSKSQLLRLNSWLKSKRLYYEIRPRSKVKIFAPNPNKKVFTIKKPPQIPGVEKKLGPRKNKLGIQMLSKPVYDQIFLEGYKETTNDNLVELSKKELSKHNMKNDDIELQADVDFKIPPLKGANIEEHFLTIGTEQIQPYKELVLELLKGIPDPPKEWLLQEGWTQYVPGELPRKVDYPLEEALVFDVEVCMMVGKTPTLATAVSNKAWYSWVSSTLIDGTYIPNPSHQYHMNSLVPLESKLEDDGLSLNENHLKPKVVIGHNVSYDRARIKEQYWINKTGTRFIDTMSLHVCVSGLTSYQRAVMKSAKFMEEDESWKNSSSLNNLVDVYNLYCRKKLSKETRNIFVEGTLLDVKEEFQNVMNYCSSDVKATYEILKELFPLFLERFPHPVTLAGMLELGTAYLPINQNWNRYITDSEQSFEDLENEGRILMARRADQACQLLHDANYKKDLWFWDEDWEVKYVKMKNEVIKKRKVDNKIEEIPSENKINEDEEIDELEEKFKALWKTKELLPKVKTILPGYPNW